MRSPASGVSCCSRIAALVAVFALLVLLTLPARAALIVYESFESYTAGAALSAGAGGTGWTANWSAIAGITAESAALTYTNGAISISGGTRTGQVGSVADNTSAASRQFASQTNSTLYMSMLFSLSAGTTDVDDFLHFMFNNDTLNTNSGGFGDLSQTTTTLDARIGTTNGGTSTLGSTSITLGTTYFLVAKLSKSVTNYDRVDLFVNPSTLTEGSPSVTDSADAGISSIAFFTLRTLAIDATDKYQFDELRIGTTYADVVPEPASTALLALGGFSTCLRRRRTRI